MTGARAGGYLFDSKLVDASEAVRPAGQAVYELATRQNPQEVVDLAQEEFNPATPFKSSLQTWSDPSRANTDPVNLQNLPLTPEARSELRAALRAAQAVYELATTQYPQEVVDLSQEEFNPATPFKSTLQTWSNFSQANTDPVNSQNLPVAEYRGGFLHERHDRVQSFRGEELSVGNASRQDNSWLGNKRVLLTFPEGEADAVIISEQDMEGLQPTRFLSDNIVDFYIKYLERTLPSKDRERFHFFNSFFFTKLLENSSASTCKVDYEQVRKWSGAANLFEKDYIFVPVLRSSHWSLIIICHLNSLLTSPDNRKGSPCVFHLDPMEGKHERFEGQVRSYILQAWMERDQAANNMDQLHALFQMTYVQAKVPQQDNGYDCGVYLLHYVEEFLCKSMSREFKFASSKEVLHFTSPHFVGEVSAKRLRIQKLILELGRVSQEQAVKCREIQTLSQDLMRSSQKLFICLDNGGYSHLSKHIVSLANGESPEQSPIINDLEHTDLQTSWEPTLDTKPPEGVEGPQTEHQPTSEVMLDWPQQDIGKPPSAVFCEPPKGRNKRKWTKDETSILLDCKVEGGRFVKPGRQGGTSWDVISEEIKSRLGTVASADQCRLRYDTLLKAYKTMKNYCTKNGLKFSEITEAERLEMKLATTLSEEWYKAIDEIHIQGPQRSKSQKRAKLSPSDGNGPHSLGPSNPAPPSPPAAPISTPAGVPTSSFEPKSSRNRQVAIPGFSRLDKDLRCTLLNLVQASSFPDWADRNRVTNRAGGDLYELEAICERLAIVQDQERADIRVHVQKLSDLKLVKIEFKWKILFRPYSFGGSMIFSEMRCVNLSDARVYSKFVAEVLRGNPDFDVYLKLCDGHECISFPMEPSLWLQRIRVLTLCACDKLEHVDLNSFPELRSLVIEGCDELKAITGWEVVKELGWLEIYGCKSYADFPRVQCLPSLRDFRFSTYSNSKMNAVSDFSKCGPRLRRLEMRGQYFREVRSMDLRTLTFLEVLRLEDFDALTAIQGLSGLQLLTHLELESLSMRGTAELGCLKALTHLDLSDTPVEEVEGVQELHLLTYLVLACKALKWLPWVGHLRALVGLDISFSGVEEIPGVEHLVSLKWLMCRYSKVKQLPALQHLPRLREVWIHDTPISRDKTSVYYGQGYMRFDREDGRMEFDDEISDISDTE